MTLKPPTKTLPKVKLVEWPTKELIEQFGQPLGEPFQSILHENLWDMYLREHPKPLSDFTRVLEGVEGQKRSQKEKSKC